METCKVDGCENKYCAKGYCSKHYQKSRTYGDPLAGIEIEMHGMHGIAEYMVWKSMKQRCLNKNAIGYKNYGGRGITICDRWRNSFMAFYEDMGLKPFPEAQIDRIDNDGDYEPGNCRWASQIENNRHRTTIKLTMGKAREIREKYKIRKISQRTLASMYQVNQKTIFNIIHRKVWRVSA